MTYEKVEYLELDDLRKSDLVTKMNQLNFGNGEHLDQTLNTLYAMIELQKKRVASFRLLFLSGGKK